MIPAPPKPGIVEYGERRGLTRRDGVRPGLPVGSATPSEGESLADLLAGCADLADSHRWPACTPEVRADAEAVGEQLDKLIEVLREAAAETRSDIQARKEARR